MVRGGINDTAALAAADVGITVAGGSQVCPPTCTLERTCVRQWFATQGTLA
jgi:soluble P-type ATPase